MTISFFILAKLSLAQEPGEFVVFLGPKNYELGSIRPSADTNIYLQKNGIINENGRIQHIYHYKNLHLFPWQIGGVKFTDLLMFYESDKLTRIDITRSYVDSIEKFNDSLQRADLSKVYDFISTLSGRKGKKKTTIKGNFYKEKGYEWKKDDTVMQSKIYYGKIPASNRLLVITIKYKWY